MWILVVEDEHRLAELLRRGLEAEGYTVDLAASGVEGEEMARLNGYDAMIVDWRLPGKDGRKVLEDLRNEGNSTPAIMLTVLCDVEHRVAGLNAGADDYLAKPFSFEELLARLRALLRRPPISQQSVALVMGPLVMNSERRTVSLNGEELVVRPKEFALLEVLLRAPGAVISRNIIAERVWGSALYVSDNVIDVTVSGLRAKLRSADPGGIELETVRGVGYRLSVKEQPGIEL